MRVYVWSAGVVDMVHAALYPVSMFVFQHVARRGWVSVSQFAPKLLIFSESRQVGNTASGLPLHHRHGSDGS